MNYILYLFSILILSTGLNAAALNDEELFRLEIEKFEKYLLTCPDINIVNENGEGLLHILSAPAEMRINKVNDPILVNLFESCIKFSSGKLEVMKLLLERKANAGLKNKFLQTPLHYAAHDYEPEILSVLLKANAIINEQDFDGKTALHNAATHGWPSVIVKTLLSANALVNIQDSIGQTALHHAAINGNHILAILLLQAGTNPKLKNNQNLTALELIHSNVHNINDGDEEETEETMNKKQTIALMERFINTKDKMLTAIPEAMLNLYGLPKPLGEIIANYCFGNQNLPQKETS